jgi:hypothetical protein
LRERVLQEHESSATAAGCERLRFGEVNVDDSGQLDLVGELVDDLAVVRADHACTYYHQPDRIPHVIRLSGLSEAFQ